MGIEPEVDCKVYQALSAWRLLRTVASKTFKTDLEILSVQSIHDYWQVECLLAYSREVLISGLVKYGCLAEAVKLVEEANHTLLYVVLHCFSLLVAVGAFSIFCVTEPFSFFFKFLGALSYRKESIDVHSRCLLWRHFLDRLVASGNYQNPGASSNTLAMETQRLYRLN